MINLSQIQMISTGSSRMHVFNFFLYPPKIKFECRRLMFLWLSASQLSFRVGGFQMDNFLLIIQERMDSKLV